MRTITALLLLCFSLSGCASTSYLARVNEEPVTGADLRREFERRHGGHQRFLAGEVEARRFLEVVIDDRLLVQEAYRLELQHDPEIEAAVALFADRRAVSLLLAQEIEARARPTPEEVRAVWETHWSTMYLYRQIVLDERERAEAVRERLVAGEDFDAVAREVSTAPSRIYGGQLSWMGWGAMPPAWEEVAFALKPGELSPVFQGGDGWEILRLEQSSAVEPPEFDKASSRIEAVLKQRALEARRAEFSKALWSKYGARLGEVERSASALARTFREAPDTVLAEWRGGSLSVGEFFSSLEMKSLAGLPAVRLQQEIDARLRTQVDAPLALLEARARGLDRDPAVLEAARRHREGLMLGALYDRFVLKDVDVSDDEVRAYFEGHRDEFVAPERRRVAHVVLASLEGANDVRKRLGEGEPFEELARTRSTDAQSARSGGDLGWISRSDVPAGFEPVLSLQEGEISEPLASKFGFHVVKVRQILPEQPQPLEAVQDAIRRKLTDQKRREARNAWVEQIRAASSVEINERGIKAFVKQTKWE